MQNNIDDYNFMPFTKEEADKIIKSFDLLADYYDYNKHDTICIQMEKRIINYKNEIESEMLNYCVELPKYYIYKQMSYITKLSRDIDKIKVIKNKEITRSLYCALINKLVTLIRKRIEVIDQLEEQIKKWNSIKCSRNKNQKRLLALIEDKICNLIDDEEEFNYKANLLANTYEECKLFDF